VKACQSLPPPASPAPAWIPSPYVPPPPPPPPSGRAAPPPPPPAPKPPTSQTSLGLWVLDSIFFSMASFVHRKYFKYKILQTMPMQAPTKSRPPLTAWRTLGFGVSAGGEGGGGDGGDGSFQRYLFTWVINFVGYNRFDSLYKVSEF